MTTRAAICTECHVGPRHGQKVDHDLIAAGHPPLDFEFSAYLANLPAHWSREDDQQRFAERAGQNGAFHFDAWLIGDRVTTLQKEKAAGRGDDFAQLDCYLCHHHFRFDADEPRVTSTMLLPASSLPPYEEADGVPRMNGAERRELLAVLFVSSAAVQTWSAALQAQLGLDAWLADQPTGTEEELRTAADELRDYLRQCYPSGQDATHYDSPREFQPGGSQLRRLRERIHERLLQLDPADERRKR